MQVRPMQAEDREEVLCMARQFYSGPAVDHAAPEEIMARTFADAVGPDPHLSGFVLQQDGQVVGFAYLTFFYSCEVAGQVVMIEELFVKEELRGRGLGQQFMTWLYGAYPQAARFRLEITAENPAVHLYRRNGFCDYAYGQMVFDR